MNIVTIALRPNCDGSPLVRKEGKQVLRDPSSVAIGIVLPVILILLFGYGLSLDVTGCSCGDRDLEDPSPRAGVGGGISALPLLPSPFHSVDDAGTHTDGGPTSRRDRADPPDFAAVWKWATPRCKSSSAATTPTRPASCRPTVRGRRPVDRRRGRTAEGRVSAGLVGMQNRLWFNEANESRDFLVPGLIVLVMTLIGAMLTSLVMAREWERGTFEALFVTPVRIDEILLGKTIPYFVLGMIGLALCLLAREIPVSRSVPRLGPDARRGVSPYLLVRWGSGCLFRRRSRASSWRARSRCW